MELELDEELDEEVNRNLAAIAVLVNTGILSVEDALVAAFNCGVGAAISQVEAVTEEEVLQEYLN